MEKQGKFSSLENYPDLEGNDSHMAHCLTEEVYGNLNGKETSSGFTIDHAIQSGLDHFHAIVRNRQSGCVAGDEQCYDILAPFFDDVIEAIHDGYKPSQSHSKEKPTELLKLNFDSNNVLSSSVRMVRNIFGFCFPTFCTRSERRIVESIFKDALSKLKGRYVSIENLLNDSEQSICGKPLSAFIDRPSMLNCVARDFPDARGLWTSDDETVVITINCDYHVTLFSTGKETNIVDAYNAVKSTFEALNHAVVEGGNQFAKNEHLGYITSFPEDLGTGLQASIDVHFPKLTSHHYFEEIVRKFRLKVSNPGKDGFLMVSNLDTIGFTETYILQGLMNGISFMEECEKRLANLKSIDRMVNNLLPILR